MENNIEVIVDYGPTLVDSESFITKKYLTIGIKYCTEGISDLNTNLNEKTKANILQSVKSGIEKLVNIKNSPKIDEMVDLTDGFFKYIKNTNTKIEIIRVSKENYINDYTHNKLKSLKINNILYTADTYSKNRVFDFIVKELYYEFENSIIDIYSILLSPKIYTIINGIPIEQRSIIMRIKNKEA